VGGGFFEVRGYAASSVSGEVGICSRGYYGLSGNQSGWCP
jgi:hypothetical protein